MRNVARRFAAAFRLELRLLCLHWTYPVLHVLWAGLLYSLIRNQDLGTAHAALEGDLRTPAFVLLSLVALFVAAASATRGERTRFTDLEDALPAGAEVILGRWLAAVTGLMGALVTPLVLAFLRGPAVSFWAGAPLFLLEGFILLAFTTAAAWWLVSVLGGRRWLYPLMAAGWLGALFLPELLLNDQVIRRHGALLFAFMKRETGDYEELWGRLLQGSLPLWFDVFYVGMTLLILALTLLSWQRRHLRRATLATGVAVLLGAAVAVAGAVNYSHVLQEREAWFRADFDHYANAEKEPHWPGETPEVVDAYDLTADLSDPSNPVFYVRLTLRNSGAAPLDAFHLTLNRHLEVVEAELPFEREGDFITLHLPRPLASGETMTLAMKYRGGIQVFEPDYARKFKPVFFTTEKSVRLATAAGWYPLAGLDEDATSSRKVWFTNTMLLPPPAAFHVKVIAPAGMVFTSNLPPAGPNEFSARSASWVCLFGSPNLREETVGRVTIVAARDDLPAIRTLAPKYEQVLDLLARFFPDVMVDGVTLAVLDNLGGIPRGTPPVDHRLDVYSARRVLNNSVKSIWGQYEQYRQLTHPLVSDVWTMAVGQNLSSEGFSVRGASTFIFIRTMGGVEKVGKVVRFRDAPRTKLALALEDVYQREGEEGAIRALNRLRRDARMVDQLPLEEIDAWIREALGS